MVPKLNIIFNLFLHRNKYVCNCLLVIIHLFFSMLLYAQTFESVKITGVVLGNETNNTLFSATSPTIASLTYIKAQRINGPQDGFFTKSGDNIRYTSLSREKGIPENLSRIRFTFLMSDKRTPIPVNDFRVIINDIDGPNNEALATKCSRNLKHIATAEVSNLIIDSSPPDLNIIGSVEENEGPTSRVLFEFSKVSEIEFDNYANEGYLKDFDFSYSSYKIAKSRLVECDTKKEDLRVDLAQLEKERFLRDTLNFKLANGSVLLNIEPIYFRNDDYVIRDEAINKLKKVLEILAKYPKIKLELESHTDSKLDDTYNLQLSENRANSTKKWIISKGINPDRITAKGYGETKLVNGCLNNVKCSEKEHQLNRRTEFIVINIEELLNIPE